MKGIRLRFLLWGLGWVLLYFLANLQLRVFPHILLIFWTMMPVLSVIYSLLSRPKLALTLQTEPSRMVRGSQGLWRCVLTNRSRRMAFFLCFPELTLARSRGTRPLELMLRPMETRSIVFSFEAPHVGRYTLRAGEPIFEDLLGFFRLRFSAKYTKKISYCDVEPCTFDWTGSEGALASFDSFQTPLPHKSFQAQSDEIFSIEPWRQGQSLRHAHWKLSARMKEWMIRHYSDTAREALRFVFLPSGVSVAPSLSLEKLTFPTSAEDEARLRQRDHLFEYGLMLLRFAIQSGTPVQLRVLDDEWPTTFTQAEDGQIAAQFLGRTPFVFSAPSYDWLSSVQKQVLLVQTLDAILLGELLANPQAAQNVFIICPRIDANEAGMRKLEETGFSCLWMEETHDE